MVAIQLEYGTDLTESNKAIGEVDLAKVPPVDAFIEFEEELYTVKHVMHDSNPIRIAVVRYNDPDYAAENQPDGAGQVYIPR